MRRKLLASIPVILLVGLFAVTAGAQGGLSLLWSQAIGDCAGFESNQAEYRLGETALECWSEFTPTPGGPTNTPVPPTNTPVPPTITPTPGAFRPDDLTGLDVWYRADAITGLNDGDGVGTLADQSGNANDASQTNSGKQPIYKTGIVNGLPALRFDNINDFMSMSYANAVSDYTIFLVVDPNWTGVQQAENYVFDADTGRLVVSLSSNATNGQDRPSFYDGAWDPYGPVIAEAWQVISFVLTADPSVFVNGTELTANGPDSYSQTAVGDEVALGSRYAGAAGFYDGDLGEFIVYDRALSVSERQDVEGWLTRWTN